MNLGRVPTCRAAGSATQASSPHTASWPFVGRGEGGGRCPAYNHISHDSLSARSASCEASGRAAAFGSGSGSRRLAAARHIPHAALSSWEGDGRQHIAKPCILAPKTYTERDISGTGRANDVSLPPRFCAACFEDGDVRICHHQSQPARQVVAEMRVYASVDEVLPWHRHYQAALPLLAGMRSNDHLSDCLAIGFPC